MPGQPNLLREALIPCRSVAVVLFASTNLLMRGSAINLMAAGLRSDRGWPGGSLPQNRPARRKPRLPKGSRASERADGTPGRQTPRRSGGSLALTLSAFSTWRHQELPVPDSPSQKALPRSGPPRKPHPDPRIEAKYACFGLGAILIS